MEPAGLAVGIAELVGLFNTRLKVVEKVNSYKSFKHDSHSLAVQFQAKKRRFEQWGSAVGINKGTLSSAHQPALDDPPTPSTAKDLLSLIHRVCANADDVASETFLLSNVNPAKRKLSVTNHVQPRGGASLNSLRRKIKLNSLAFWCSTCKTSFPPNGVKSTSTVYSHPQVAEVLDICKVRMRMYPLAIPSEFI
ncbi:hypothetical protein CGCF415_v015088 [Colletotrichum fructicola]|uniref:Ankyrin repeat domain-containing protein 52 n=1 Tax=Colletotrichum fructicola (strain Nara gc5) TaxID=1213859 RepID=L2FIR2_COLFN|nr:uncharacterized protein CGMCC3_g17155 [Colletotrichum fructicola]KAE9566708.1 hypothetical protein CGMCC3_g17155 [Colletotrichum fructicola]KAF4430686.1 hypothetical protein CFRS1_v009676 [Colletotrichum fructicola]KAF4881739.1 hypothetical protein CGCFRS4_v015257 [Colletotrichum fructicola]KAF4886616.1 hypothetical protein CGCF415_v015088 [Colletotrichum fructicola]KAF4922746.1 hypothetical protein CGCF245_v015211 [Colletotrichum fructicola]